MPSAPLDTLEAVLNTARVRINDAIAALGGDILTDVQPFTPVIVNGAWRRLQELLANYGFQALNRDVILPGVPGVSFADQGTFAWINWANYFNGGLLAAPVLPQDMIAPLALEERVAGTTINFTPIDQCFNGLPTIPKTFLNKVWEWRNETIFLPGATGSTDIRLRYAGYFSDFVIGQQTTLSAAINNAVTAIPVVSGTNIPAPFYIQIDSEIMQVTLGVVTPIQVARAQLGTAAAAHNAGAPVILLPNNIPVPIMRSLNSFAWFMCSEMARIRGDMDAGYFDQQATASAEYIFNRDYRGPKSLFKGSELGKMTDAETPTEGPQGPRGMEK